MAIKKVKVASVWVNDEKEITSKKDSKVYRLCEVNCKLADDSKDYAGKYVKITFFEYKDLKDEKKNKTATSKADYFKTQTEGQEILLNITEQEYVNKEGQNAIGLTGKILSKKEKEVAEQFLK